MSEIIDYKIDLLKSAGRATLSDYLDAVKGVADGELTMVHVVEVMEAWRNEISYLDDIITPFLKAYKNEFASFVKEKKKDIQRKRILEELDDVRYRLNHLKRTLVDPGNVFDKTIHKQTIEQEEAKIRRLEADLKELDS